MSVLDRAENVAAKADGMIPAACAARLLLEAATCLDQLMLELIPLAKQFAQAPLSNFRVGAIAEGVSGALYFGANFEFVDCPINQSVHAEQATVINAACHGETGIKRMAVSAAPCGHCRQFLYELRTANELTIVQDGVANARLIDYLPAAFGPGDLGVTAGLLSRQHHHLEFADCESREFAGADTALAAAKTSYAPYTGAYGGAAIVTRNAAIYGGPYLENAAFNPSLSPMQAAIVRAALSGCEPGDFAEVCVAQGRGSKIDHAEAASWLLASLASGIQPRTVLFDTL